MGFLVIFIQKAIGQRQMCIRDRSCTEPWEKS